MVFALHVAGAYGQEAIAWEDLSNEEQQLLQQVERRWEQLSLERQVELREGAQRWQEMEPDERDRLRRRLEDLVQRRSLEVRERIVRRFQQFNDAPPAHQRRLKEVRERFQSLSPDDREALRLRFEKQQQLQQQDSVDEAAERRNQEFKESAADSPRLENAPLRPEPPRFERPRPQGGAGHRPRPPRQQ